MFTFRLKSWNILHFELVVVTADSLRIITTFDERINISMVCMA